MKKQAIKITTAAAIAASAFVAVAPTQSEAATSSVDKAITKATNQMAKAYDTYHKAAKNEGELPSTSTIRKQVELAKEYYSAATKEIAKNGGSKAKKATYTKKLNDKKYFLDRAENYLAAVNTNLNPAKRDFTAAVEGGKQKTVLAAQTALNEKIAEFEATVAKIYGPDARNLLLEKYATPAIELANTVNDEMTVYEAYKQIENEKLIEKDYEKAGKIIADVKAEVEKLKEKDTKLAKNIIAAVEKNNKAYADALVPEVKEVKAINDKTVEVTLETAKKDLTDKNFKILVDGKEVTPSAVKSDDNGEVYTLTVAGLENKDGKVAVNGKETAFEFATPKVKEVNAINAKTVVVEFNRAIDAKTLVKADKDVISVVVGEGATAPGEINQELSKDGKTLTLTATNTFKGDYTVKVPFEIVKDVDGKFVSPINAKVAVNDKEAPVLTSAKSTIKDTKDGLKKITLGFNEEVVSIDTVKINGVNYSAAVNGKEATVVVDLDAAKTYDVTVVNATDAAGNVKDVQVAPVSVAVDSLAPSILSVVPTGENKVTVTLDKELADDKLNITGKVGTFATNIVTDATVNPKNKKEYTVELNNSYLFKNGNSDTVTLTVAKEQLADTLGNKNSTEISKTVVVNKDASAPNVEKVATSTKDGKVNSFSVTYNEEVKSPTLSKASVVNSKGEILSVGSVVSKVEVSAEDAKTVIFTLADGLATDKYSFDLAEGFVEDTALTANKSAKYAFNVEVTEAGKPVETSFSIKDATVEANVITVDFDAKVKATGTGSALNPSAYQLNGVALPSDTVIEFAKNDDQSINQTKAVITLPEGFVKANDEKAIFRVNAIQTLDNKLSNQFSKVIPVTDNTAPEVKSLAATDLNKLTVTYSEAIKLTDDAKAADIQDEIKLVDSKGAAIEFTEATVTKDGKLVLTVEDAINVKSLTTVKVAVEEQDIFDLNNVTQKAGVTVSK